MPTIADLISQMQQGPNPGDQVRDPLGQGQNLVGLTQQPGQGAPPPPGLGGPQAMPPSPNVPGPLAAPQGPPGVKPRIKLRAAPQKAKPKIKLKASAYGGTI